MGREKEWKQRNDPTLGGCHCLSLPALTAIMLLAVIVPVANLLMVPAEG